MTPLPPVPEPAAMVAQGGRVSEAWFKWFNPLRAIVFALQGRVLFGRGSPVGVVVADRGTLFLRDDGGASTTLYVKEGGDASAVGWRAV